MNIAQRPQALRRAETALWAWLTWACAVGLYQAHVDIADLQTQIDGDFGGMIDVQPAMIFKGAIAIYVIVAAASAWALRGLARGKHWARSSFLWSFIFQAAATVLPPYHNLREYLTDIPDLGLQIFALWLLYVPPGSVWFEEDARLKKKG